MLKIFTILNIIFCDANSLVEKLYLTPPYVDAKGRSIVCNLTGHNAILAYGGDQYIQLGYQAPYTQGILMYKTPIDSLKFAVDFNISLKNLFESKNSRGMAIFITPKETIEKGELYGIDGDFEGICVVIDTENVNKTWVSVATGKFSYDNSTADKIFKKKTYFEFYDDELVTIRIEQNNGRVKVTITNDYDNVSIYESDKYLMDLKSYIGVSADNGKKGEISYTLRSIQVNHLKHVNMSFEKGEREGSHKITWLMFIVGVFGLVYYIYTNQVQKLD